MGTKALFRASQRRSRGGNRSHHRKQWEQKTYLSELLLNAVKTARQSAPPPELAGRTVVWPGEVIGRGLTETDRLTSCAKRLMQIITLCAFAGTVSALHTNKKPSVLLNAGFFIGHSSEPKMPGISTGLRCLDRVLHTYHRVDTPAPLKPHRRLATCISLTAQIIFEAGFSAFISPDCQRNDLPRPTNIQRWS